MPHIDFALQADLAVRMLIAAVLGAAIGLEREIHEHPAGMRTHLLVSLGSAIFTVLSIYGVQRTVGAERVAPTSTRRGSRPRSCPGSASSARARSSSTGPRSGA